MNELMAETYDQLRKLAHARYRGLESLSPTDLVHEVYLRLRHREFEGPTHFKAVAARAMRMVVVDRVRARNADKRGGGWHRVSLQGLHAGGVPVGLIDLSEALDHLEEVDERLVRIAEMRLFAGMEVREIASALEVSESTVKRDWRTARAWLITEVVPDV